LQERRREGGSGYGPGALARLKRGPLPLRTIRPELSANLEAVIGRALAQDPADRFQLVAELSAGFASVPAKTGVLERLFGDV
jgi:hypothetical protein